MKFKDNEEKIYQIFMTHEQISKLIDWWEDNDVPNFLGLEQLFKEAEEIQ